MNYLDLIVLFGTMLFIVAYGVWKTRQQSSIESYLLGGKSMSWGTIGLSVMATQASAITFISTPGQAYESGMGFVQNYFGMPIALIIVSAFFIPIFYRLKVYTAYEYLESRFDLKTRLLGAGLFLIQRGMAAGITIYAPAIIISSILDWNLTATILFTGILVVIYTVSGGTRAVSITQKQQMTVIMIGMFVAFFMIIYYITDFVSFGEALTLAGKLDKLNAVDLDLSFEKRYTIWSGILGGVFLSLSYFGTDQSQVQRYLGGKNITESRMGLMFNAILKIPMQFFILFVGVMVYVFYLFHTPPVHFKDASLELVRNSEKKAQFELLEQDYAAALEKRKTVALELAKSSQPADEQIVQFQMADAASNEVRNEVKSLIKEVAPQVETKDSDYVFLTFILTYLPHGLIGLLIAVIFSAAMSSSSSELNALASTTTVDLYKRVLHAKDSVSDQKQVFVSKLLTFCWGVLAISFAILAKNSENLIEAINIVGSIFYGTILGIFIVAFFFKSVKGTAVFWATIISQIVVIVFHALVLSGKLELGYLWYNAIGLGLTVVLSLILQMLIGKK